MTHILAAPDFARGKGLVRDVREVVSSIGAVGKRLNPSSVVVTEECQDAMQYLLSHGVTRETADYAMKTAKKKGAIDPQCSDPIYIITGWNQARLHELNQQWGAPDPAAYVRDALIASGMTTTADPRVLGVTDANLHSTSRNFHDGLAGFPIMVPACGMTEEGAIAYARAARPPVIDACVLLANGGSPRPLLDKDMILWIG